MITQNEIARKDFDRICLLKGYETFTEKQITGLSNHIKGIIEKSSREQLSSDEVQSIHAYNEDVSELKKALVLNNDMTREVVYYRERQVIFDDSIEKSEDGELIKARSGVYANTAQNRKAGRVGQKYGGKKEKDGNGQGKDNIKAEDLKSAFSYMIDKDHIPKNLTGNVSIKMEPRDTKGMAGNQDKYQMSIYQNGKKVGSLGSHPSKDFDATEMVKKEIAKKEGTEKKEDKPLIADNKEDIDFKKHPYGGEIAKYKTGDIMRNTEDGKTSYSVEIKEKDSKNSMVFNTKSLEDSIELIDNEGWRKSK